MKQLKITQSFTIRESSSLDKYLHDISQEELITADEEVELARNIKKGDKNSLDKLVRSNLRFVVSVAKQYQNQGLTLEDLINEGNLGLIKAANKFDETRGFKFISYAVWWIRQTIMQAIAEHSRVIRIPLSQSSHINKIKKATTAFETEYGRKPSILDVASLTQLTPEQIKVALSYSTYYSSLNSPLTDDSDTQFIDVLTDCNSPEPDHTLTTNSLTRDIQLTINSLPIIEQQVIKPYFGINCKQLTPDDIAAQLSISKERVRQIKDRAIRRIRHSSAFNLLKQYLE